MTRTNRHYCFTYWKLPENIKNYCEKISKIEYFRYIIAQLEISPTTKQTHIQGYIEFDRKTAIKKIQNVMPGIHVELRKGTREQAKAYCLKEESAIAGTLIEMGEFQTEQGKRNDIIFLKKQVKDGKNLAKIIIEDCISYQQIRIVEKLNEYTSKPRNPYHPPSIRWYWGATGTGKTRSVYNEFKMEDIYPSFSYKWWNGYYQQKVILIDDMRKDYAKFHILLKLLDRYPHIVEIKGGTTHINSQEIIITSAFHPRELYDTREDVEQLIRRITTIKKFEMDHKSPIESITLDQYLSK